jgi:protein-disulfide isomerase
MNSGTRNLFLGALIAIAVIGIGLIVFSQRPSGDSSTAAAGADTKTVKFTENGQPQQITLTKVNLDPAAGARFTLGKADAPVTMVEFGDYECPTCGLYAVSVGPQFKSEFIDTGKVRFVFRDFPLGIHPNAPQAANAAACANDQGRWESMHDILYRSQALWSNSSNDVFTSQLVDYARQLGLDEESFKTCLSANKSAADVPTFVVNGYRVDSDHLFPIEGFRAIMAAFGVQ